MSFRRIFAGGLDRARIGALGKDDGLLVAASLGDHRVQKRAHICLPLSTGVGLIEVLCMTAL